MQQITITELSHGITAFKGYNVTIDINNDTVAIKSHGVTLKTAKLPTMTDNEYVGYCRGSVVIANNNGGTIDELKSVIGIEHKIFDIDGTVFDVKNCVGCGAYSRAYGIEHLIKLCGLSRDIAEQLI